MKIKKWNGSSWVQDYPEVNVANIVATGTADSSTFLRGDGQWVEVTAGGGVENLGDLGISATATELNVLDGITATTTELNYVDGVTSAIQTQLDGKLSGNQTITLSGDVSGSGTTSISVTVADDSHNHIIANVDGLQTALNAKANLASPALTGTPSAPTATAGTNTTQIATTAFVSTAVSNLVDSSPATLNTLNELAAALGDDPNFATTVANDIGTKLSLSGGTMTGPITMTDSGDPIYLNRIGSRGTEIYIGAGESLGSISGGAEAVYIAGESGVNVYASSDNLTSGLNRSTTLIDTAGNMTINNGGLTVSGGNVNIAGNNIDVDEQKGFVNSGAWTRNTTPHGYIDFGPANTSYAHIYTDRPSFYINKELYSLGNRMFHDGYHPNADTLTTARNIALTGDVTGSASFNGSANISITATVADDSHNHTIANVDGLQTALNGKAALTHNHSATEIVTGELNTARMGSGTATTGYVLKSDGDGTASWQVDSNTTYSLGSFGITATATELNYTDGVTSNIQTQLNGKAASSHTHDDRYYTETEVNNLLAGKQAAGTYNTIIGTDTDLDTSGATIIDNIYVTDGVITSMGTRVLQASDINALQTASYPYYNPVQDSVLRYNTTYGWLTTTLQGEWQLIYSGSTFTSSGTTATTVTTSVSDLADDQVLAIEFHSVGTTSTYTTSIQFVKLGSAANNQNSAVMFPRYATTTYTSITSLLLYRSSASAFTVNYIYQNNSNSTTMTADSIYIGRVWRIKGVLGA